MKKITMDVFAQTALAYDLGCCSKLDEPSPIARAFDFLGSEFTRRLANPLGVADTLYFSPTQANRRHAQEQHVLRSFLSRIIDERRNGTATNKSEDLLASLLRATDEQKDQNLSDELYDQTLSDLLMSLLFAGYDTTSITLTYALYNLARHQEAEELCVKDINRVYKEKSGDCTTADDFWYCRAVLRETLRLYPPPFIVSRFMTKRLTLPHSGFTIPEGTLVFMPVYQIQRDPKHFARPLEFHPERWTEQNKNGTWQDRPSSEASDSEVDDNRIPAANRQAFFAFSAGARSCAGQTFAMQPYWFCQRS